MFYMKKIDKSTKKILQVEKEKKIYSHTFFLYDKNTIVKATYISEINTIIIFFGKFTIFC